MMKMKAKKRLMKDGPEPMEAERKKICETEQAFRRNHHTISTFTTRRYSHGDVLGNLATTKSPASDRHGVLRFALSELHCIALHERSAV